MQDVVTGETVSGTSAAADGTLGHDNQAGVHLEIRPSSKVRIGEAVTYRVESGRAGHLLIVDVAADGTVTQLFPNEYSEQAGRGAAIAPGRAIEIPNAYYGFRLVAGPPTGRGTLFAIVTEDPVSLDDLLGRTGTCARWPMPRRGCWRSGSGCASPCWAKRRHPRGALVGGARGLRDRAVTDGGRDRERTVQ